MNKKIVQEVLERSRGLCERCGGNRMVQLHHIIGGNGNRRQCETTESVIALCWDCHHGTNGVHGKNGSELDLELKQGLEKTYREQGRSEEEIQYLLGGKFYIWIS